MHKPTSIHLQAVKHILKYLKYTIIYGIFLRRSSSRTLQAYSDTDWAGCPDDRKSIRRFYIFLGPNLISWSSRKQRTVACSNVESEYRTPWPTPLLNSSAFNPCFVISAFFFPLLLFNGVITLANSTFHTRTKYREIGFHFVRDKIASKRWMCVSFPARITWLTPSPKLLQHLNSLTCGSSATSSCHLSHLWGCMNHQENQLGNTKSCQTRT